MAKEPPLPGRLPDFGELPWDDLYPRLLLAGMTKLHRMVWNGEVRGQVPGGRTAQDAVQTAVKKFLGGRCQWNWSASAFDNLWGAVSSEISNWGTSADNRTTSRASGEKVTPLRADLLTPENAAVRMAASAGETDRPEGVGTSTTKRAATNESQDAGEESLGSTEMEAVIEADIRRLLDNFDTRLDVVNQRLNRVLERRRAYQ